MVVVAFDFDGTLTTKDTFIEFIKFTHGKIKFYFGFLVLSPVLILFKMGVIPNYRAKQIVFSFFYKGWCIEKFNARGRLFSEQIDLFLRKQTYILLQEHLAIGNHVLIVSASIENWITPWATRHGVKEIAATTIQVINGKITGSFVSKNCYGQEKVERLLELYPNREEYVLFAYGNSKGDRQLLTFADKPFKI